MVPKYKLSQILAICTQTQNSLKIHIFVICENFRHIPENETMKVLKERRHEDDVKTFKRIKNINGVTNITELFKTNKRVRKGGIFSPLLFTALLNETV